MDTLLCFDYVDHNGKKNPLTFENPLDVVVATKIEEVLPALQKVQAAVDNGYYAAGYLSYEAAPAFNQAFQVNRGNKMPLVWVGIFDSAVAGTIKSSNPFHTTDWRPNESVDAYYAGIEKVKHYIEQRDTSQVNYTIRMHSKFEGDPIAFYNQLANAQSANYSAFLNTGDYTILSASPELFFHMKDGIITTKPMKGTVGRGKTAAEDLELKEWLFTSEKNRTENEMIVHLMKNELGKLAKHGTVQVPHLFAIEKYPTVYQMTSTVTAELPHNKNVLDVLKALFPCGSITGTPKIRTMNLIAELESTPREVYCGAIGFITPDHEAIFNVPIRTVMIENDSGNAQYGVGGGITRDSTKEEEYNEVLTKAKLLNEKRRDFQLLETLGLFNGAYVVLENHLTRVMESADYFNFQLDVDALKQELFAIAEKNKESQLKVRLLVSSSGEFSIETNVISPISEKMAVTLAKKPIPMENIFLYHKTTNRDMYIEHRDSSSNVFDVLLWNEHGEITEFTNGNIVVEIDGKLYTPPVDCGLLAGTFRKALLQDGVIAERKISMDELKICSQVWFINSVRKWVPVYFNI